MRVSNSHLWRQWLKCGIFLLFCAAFVPVVFANSSEDTLTYDKFKQEYELRLRQTMGELDPTHSFVQTIYETYQRGELGAHFTNLDTNRLSPASAESVIRLDSIDDNMIRMMANWGLSSLKEGKVAIVDLAGGEGTRWWKGFDPDQIPPKALEPIMDLDFLTRMLSNAGFSRYLPSGLSDDIPLVGRRALQMGILQRQLGIDPDNLPVGAIAGGDKAVKIREFMARNKNYGVNFFIADQNRFIHRVDPQTGKFLTGSDMPRAVNGHGPALYALILSPEIQRLVFERGLEWIYVGNVGNPYSDISLARLALAKASNADFIAEVVPKTAQDRGGFYMRLDGHDALIEGWMLKQPAPEVNAFIKAHKLEQTIHRLTLSDPRINTFISSQGFDQVRRDVFLKNLVDHIELQKFTADVHYFNSAFYAINAKTLFKRSFLEALLDPDNIRRLNFPVDKNVGGRDVIQFETLFQGMQFLRDKNGEPLVKLAVMRAENARDKNTRVMSRSDWEATSHNVRYGDQKSRADFLKERQRIVDEVIHQIIQKTKLIEKTKDISNPSQWTIDCRKL